MKNIRIGNDIKIEWSLYDGGSAFILEGRAVKVYLKDKYGRKEITDYVISGNMLTWTFHGKNQRRTGAYSLELVVNENENGMITTDACQFVNLVHCSCDVAGSDDNGVSTETIELRSQLSVGGSSGEGGGSYDDTAIWKAVNNKVDKVVGKGLSTNDYTDTDKSKLAGLKNYDDTKLKEEIAETYATKEYVDEAVGNAGGGGEGCECATPDWSAPEGKEGHILNRTHYRDNPIEDGSYDESNLSWGDTREIYPYGHKYYKVTINGESHIIDFVGKDWPQYDFEKDEQNKLEYDLQFDNNVGLKLSFFQNGGGYPRLVLEYYPTDPAAPETIDVNITDYAVDFKRLSDEFIPDTIARTSELTELSAELGDKQDTITDLETIRSGAEKGATALQSVPDTYATKTYVDNAIKEIPQGGGEPSQYIKDASKSADGNTLTLTKKDGSIVSFSPSGGGTGGGVSKEYYYDITINDDIYRVLDACANSRYVVVGSLKGISLYDRLTDTQIISERTTNIAAVKLTSEGVYVLRGNLLEVRDFNLTILHTVDLGHSDFDKVTFTDNECYAVIDGALTRITTTSEPQIVVGYESNVAFVKHAYNVGTSIVMLDSSDNKYYLSILEYPAYKSPVPNQSLVYVGATNGYMLVKTAINTLGIVSNQLILGRLHNETFSDIKVALSPLTQVLIIKSCSVVEGVIFSVATTKNFISDKVAIMNNTIYNISNPDLTSHTLCAVLGQVGNERVTRIKVMDL